MADNQQKTEEAIPATEAVAQQDPSADAPAEQEETAQEAPPTQVEALRAQSQQTKEEQTAEDAPTPDEAAAPEAETEEVAAEEREAPRGPVSRMLADAVEAASQDIGFPSSDEADIVIADEVEPDTSVEQGSLERQGEFYGFTGEIQGRVVKLDELTEADEGKAVDPIYDQFRQLVEQTSSDVREQEIVTGRVLRVSGDDVVIDIGYKSDGIVDIGEFGDRDLQPGDEVEVYLEYKEDRQGQLVLSKTKADSVRRWQRIEEIFENEEIIEGTITRRIKGGMIVELFDGMEAFLPGSQIDVRPVRDFDAYLERRMEFKIVKLNPGNDNIVVSHRALVQKELEKQREEILSQMEVGQVLQGTVKNIVDFGVFVDLGGVDGLLHITDLSWGRVSHPSEMVDLDEELQVVVLDYEEERQRISLGLKQLTEHPWENITEKYDQDEVVEGKVVSITNYGAFVELEKGIEGLVHISEMSWTRHIKHPSQMVSLGQLVDVQVLNIDEEGRKISLGMKQLEPDPWDGIADRYPPGTTMSGTIRNITHFGVFVEIEPGIDGLVHISDLSWTKKVRHPKEVAEKGQEMDVVILNIDEDRKRISLGHKQVSTNPWEQFAKAYAEGTDVTATVERVESKGLVVELPLGVEGFVPGSELKQGPRDFQDYYQDGQEVDLRVIRFDGGRKDIVLSETAKDRAESRAEDRAERQAQQRERREQDRSVREFQDQARSTTGPATVGELSGLADLKRQMQAAEASEAAAQTEEAAVEADNTATAETPEVPKGGQAQSETQRTTPEDADDAEMVTGAKASGQLDEQVGKSNRPRSGKRSDQGGDAGSNTEPAQETAQRKEEAGDLPPAEGAQAALKGDAEVEEKTGLAAAAEAATRDETPTPADTAEAPSGTAGEKPQATTDPGQSVEEVEAFVEATGNEAVTTGAVKSAGDEAAEEGFPEGFPHVSRLTDAGYTSLADLRAVDDYTEIDGIGPAYAQDITEALAKLGEAEEGS